MSGARSVTKVVSIKVASLRADTEYDNAEQWLKDTANNVYVGREQRVFITDKETRVARRFVIPESLFANPFSVKVYGRARAIQLYKERLWRCIENDPELKTELLALRGKTLGCWCAPEPCHADAIVEVLEELE